MDDIIHFKVDDSYRIVVSEATQSELILFSSVENRVKRRKLPSFDNENIRPSRSPVDTTSRRLPVEFSIIQALPADK